MRAQEGIAGTTTIATAEAVDGMTMGDTAEIAQAIGTAVTGGTTTDVEGMASMDVAGAGEAGTMTGDVGTGMTTGGTQTATTIVGEGGTEGGTTTMVGVEAVAPATVTRWTM